MPYATAQDLIDRFGETELIELTDRSSLGTVDATAIARALADADGEINSYLSSRYSLPLGSVPPVLVKFACDIARYQLYDTHASEQVKARYDDAIKYFKQLALGVVSLGLDPINAPVTDAGGVQIVANERVFSRDKLADY